MRRCIGCRQTAGVDALLRITCTDGHRLAVGRHLPGRGAWLCDGSGPCLEAAVRSRAFGRALRCEPEPGAVEALVTELAWPAA